jgi:presenilin 1
MILFLLGFWDLFAVLTPCGPLRWLVDLVHEKGTPLPGLLYRAAIADSHQAKEAPHAIEIEPTRARMSENEFISWLLSPVRTPDTSARQSPPPPTQVLDFHQQVVSFLFDQRSNAQYRALDISQRYTDQQIKLWRSLYTYYEIRSVSPSKPYPSTEVIFARVATSPPDPQLSDIDDEDESIRLGLGDFIFYSVLVARAAMHGVAPFAACFFCVIAVRLLIVSHRLQIALDTNIHSARFCGQGLGVTMYLLAHYDALPALPISVFSGIFAYLLTVQLLVPLVDYLTSFSIMAI